MYVVHRHDTDSKKAKSLEAECFKYKQQVNYSMNTKYKNKSAMAALLHCFVFRV